MNKLTGHKLKIFKYIFKHQNQELTRFNISKHFKSISKTEIELHIKSLRDDEFIFYSGLNDNINLSSKGLTYFSERRSYRLELFLKSIFCPIVVAFITTLITLWLKHLL